MKKLDLEINTLNDIVGQFAIIDTLKELLDKNELSNFILLCGEKGTGKTSVAKYLKYKLETQGKKVSIKYTNDYLDTPNKLINKNNYAIYIIEDYHEIPKEKRDLMMMFYFNHIPPSLIEERLNKICEQAGLPNMKKVNNILAHITTTNFKEPISLYKELNGEMIDENHLKEFREKVNNKYKEWLKKQKDYINFTKSILYKEDDFISNYESWINKEEYNSFILKLIMYIEDKTSVKFSKVLLNDLDEIINFEGSFEFYLSYSKEVMNIINNKLSFKELSKKISGD